MVTGGAGFIGSHIVDRLLRMGHEVVCIDNFDPYYDPEIKKNNIKNSTKNENFRLVKGNILDGRLLNSIVRTEGIDYVVHMAAQAGVRASIKNPKKTSEINVLGTLNVLRACIDSEVKKVVNASSSSVYGEVEYLPLDEEHPKSPTSPYGVSKLTGEHYCRIFNKVYGVKSISVRYFTVYGPKMRPDLAISIFTRKALKNEPIKIFGDGTKTRDFTFVDDAVNAAVQGIKKEATGEYNIGGGNRISVQELAEKIISITGSKSRIIYSGAIEGEAEHTLADITKARRDLGWSPKTDVDEGLNKYIKWFTEKMEG